MIDGPLGRDGTGGFEPIPDVDQGQNIAIGVRDQYWIFAISITKGAEDGERVYVDALPSFYELAPVLEDSVGCLDGICDGIGEAIDCPVTVTQSTETLIDIEPDGLNAGDICTTTVYVKLREEIESCQQVATMDGSGGPSSHRFQ